ncbi:hypothetical protein [Paenibacillus polymyxa]|uniref:hypothetical protein n=1 Tax=Paenibacillus TaxID=44249 RepID=UPI0018687732|nr:hypothetical protein [Paenibacillus polymyxa]MBE3649146.1 hypothetical protein [Paenibacillus polymyxa]
MKLKLTTQDKVRDLAVRVLDKHPEGLRQVELFKLVGDEMVSKGINFSDSIIKNSLWNLDKTRSEHVIKKQVAPRNVLLFPKDVSEFEAALTTYEDQEAEEDIEYAVARSRLFHTVLPLVYKLQKEVETSYLVEEISRLLDTSDHFSREQLEVLFKLMSTFSDLQAQTVKLLGLNRKYRDEQGRIISWDNGGD